MDSVSGNLSHVALHTMLSHADDDRRHIVKYLSLFQVTLRKRVYLSVALRRIQSCYQLIAVSAV